MVLAAAALGVALGACVVIGDIGADLEAARAAGARGVLVPNAARASEVAAAEEVASSLAHAAELVLGARGPTCHGRGMAASPELRRAL